MEQTYTDSNREGLAARMPATNVGNIERVVTVAAGAALLGYAWRHRSRGLGLASAGLIARGATGFCPAYAAVGVDHSDTRHALVWPARHSRARIDHDRCARLKSSTRSGGSSSACLK